MDTKDTRDAGPDRRSIWTATAGRTTFPPLGRNLEVEVAIVGGGITGITTAALLAADGRRVAVLEAARVGMGIIASSLKEDAEVARTTLLARIQEADGKVIELRSPLPGRINKILKTNGAQISAGEEVISLSSDEASVFEALRALTIIGSKDDVPVVQAFASSPSQRISQQADLTAKVLQSRNTN